MPRVPQSRYIEEHFAVDNHLGSCVGGSIAGQEETRGKTRTDTMTINESHSNISRPRRARLTVREQKLKHLQADLVSTARMLAMDDVGAAMARDLRAPLTALLSSLHMIEEERKAGLLPSPDAMQKLIERAILEAQHLREITERLGRGHRAGGKRRARSCARPRRRRQVDRIG
jgi:signal transduction histidine kinase